MKNVLKNAIEKTLIEGNDIAIVENIIANSDGKLKEEDIKYNLAYGPYEAITIGMEIPVLVEDYISLSDDEYSDKFTYYTNLLEDLSSEYLDHKKFLNAIRGKSWAEIIEEYSMKKIKNHIKRNYDLESIVDLVNDSYGANIPLERFAYLPTANPSEQLKAQEAKLAIPFIVLSDTAGAMSKEEAEVLEAKHQNLLKKLQETKKIKSDEIKTVLYSILEWNQLERLVESF